MNIFQKIKHEVDFLSAMEHYCGPLKQIGDETFTTEEDECPIHGGHGCFRMKVDGENSMITCFGNCDHDEYPVDLIEFVRIKEQLDTVGEAARMIAKDFDVKMPVETPTNRIFREAFNYYRDLFEMGSKKLKNLGKKTPKEYQLEVRHHSEETLEAIMVGWSDGGLTEHLEDDFSEEELVSSGLVKEFRGKLVDVLPADSFIYPHFWGGRLSRFSFKHKPSSGNVLTFQMKKQYWLNDIEFFAVGQGTPVAVVEGEDDLATLLDEGWEGTVLCTNGSFSKGQLDWLAAHPTEYHTFWDGDAAGDKYTEKMWKIHLTGKVPDLFQWALPEGADIDDYLKEYELNDLTAKEPPAREEIVDVIEKNRENIVEEAGCYKVITVSKDGETETRIPITDFTIQLLYVKILGEERSRVVRILRNDGRKSKPITVNSEAKVSLRHFKILVANAVDASFVGSELDLAAMWTYVYNRQREAVVDVPAYVGDLEGDGWIFGNQYIGPDGDVQGDEDNIMWLNEKKTKGVAPKSLMAPLSSTTTASDIPLVWRGENTDEFLKDIALNLNEILKDPGLVLTILGWAKSCAYSMPMFYDAKVKFFPFLLLWGRHGRGKSTLSNWILSLYDMADKGTTTVGQLRSGVGIERKLSYYRGLPYCIDELRADRQASEYSRTWRGWYNRSSRVKGTRKSEDIIQVPLNACLFFSGQDTFTDPAMRSRCIPCKFPTNAGDDIAYTWLEDEVDNFPTVGYQWIREAMDSDIHDVKESVDELKSGISAMCPPGISSRSVANYAMVANFSVDIGKEVFPEFDYLEWIVNALSEEYVEAMSEDMVQYFWAGLSGLQVGDNPRINGNHVQVKNDKLYLWYPEAFRTVAGTSADARESMSRGAVRDALCEEPYFAGNVTARIGPTNTSRRCMSFDLDHPDVPQELREVAETSQVTF